jgi:hypothetical protein
MQRMPVLSKLLETLNDCVSECNTAKWRDARGSDGQGEQNKGKLSGPSHSPNQLEVGAGLSIIDSDCGGPFSERPEIVIVPRFGRSRPLCLCGCALSESYRRQISQRMLLER